jgi:hypothetical protein
MKSFREQKGIGQPLTRRDIFTFFIQLLHLRQYLCECPSVTGHLDQRSSTWGTTTHEGKVKTFYGVRKIREKILYRHKH